MVGNGGADSRTAKGVVDASRSNELERRHVAARRHNHVLRYPHFKPAIDH